MDPERWKQIEQIYHAALERKESQRSVFLQEACGGDSALRQEVESLLAHQQEAEDFIEAPALEVAAQGLAEDQAQSLIGGQLGSYKILSLLGEGGMGKVYRAQDTKLEREVAVKALPPEFSREPQRLARFEREAKLLASLNHPNIAAIYGLEEAEGVRFLSLELVEGETLAERVAKGPLPVEEALEVCRQIAEGVEAAHEKGVIHRDLKPANVKITPEGKVKILDFGIAKALEGESAVADLSQPDTLTRTGVILGTAAYMSPEQARGKPVDKRADIWAFGCVLYELLAGKRLFERETVNDTLAKVLEGEPDWKILPGATPWRILELLRRCLTKDAHNRLRDIAHVRIEIKLALTEPVTVQPTGDFAQAAPQSKLPWVAALILAVITGVAVWNLKPTEPQPVTARFYHELPEGQAFTSTGRPLVEVSPDGSKFVYVANGQPYLRNLDDMAARPIQGTVGATTPFFSPDGEWVAYWSRPDSQIKKIATIGGAAVTLCDATNPFGASWGSDDTILYGQYEGIMRVSANGGAPELIIPTEASEQVHGPQMLPGGEWVLFTLTSASGTARWDEAQIVVQSLDSGERKILWEGGSDARYVPTGHLVNALEDVLFALPFDLASLEVSGRPVSIVEGVRRAIGPGGPELNTASANYGFSDRGTLIYVPGPAVGVRRILALVDREGAVEPLGAPPGAYVDPRLSPDGRRLAVTIREENSDVWVYDLGRRTFSRLTFDPRVDETPIWTPDGKWVTFAAGMGGVRNLLRRLADGSGEEEQLVTLQEHAHPNSWSPDGQVLVFGMGPTGTASEGIWLLPLEGDRKPTLFLKTPFNVYASRLSPDGHWIAYASNESGRSEIYVQPFPGLGRKWQISTDGGGHAVWARNGRELFYRNGDRMMLVEVTTQPNFAPGSPKALFEGQFFTPAAGNTAYDVAPDGQHFLMIQHVESEQVVTQIHVVLNWFEELKRLVPTGE